MSNLHLLCARDSKKYLTPAAFDLQGLTRPLRPTPVHIFTPVGGPGCYVSSAAAMIQSTQSFGQVSNGIAAMTSFAKGLAPAAKALEGAAQAEGLGATNAAANAADAVKGLVKALPLGALSVPPSWSPVSAVHGKTAGRG